MIDQDTTISRQLTLWDQRGSRVIRGNLLVIPIDEALLYIVEPVYLRAVENDLPQLKRIIVSDGETLAMEPSLKEAYGSSSAGARGNRRSRRRRQRCRASTWARPAAASTRPNALACGDWQAFGRAMQVLRQVLMCKATLHPELRPAPPVVAGVAS